MAAGAAPRGRRGGSKAGDKTGIIVAASVIVAAGWHRAALSLAGITDPGYNCGMESVDEIFDDANGDLAIGDLESAVEKYRRCVELDAEFFDGWHALGMALMKLGRFPEAIEAGKRTVALKPNDQIGWTSLSLFYNRNGDIKEAEAAGTKAKILSWGGKIAH